MGNNDRIERLAKNLGSLADTIRHEPHNTIRPQRAGGTEDGKRALAMLQPIAVEADSEQTARLTMRDTIGSGGMGVVRLADQVALGRKVAVKALRAEFVNDDTTLKLLREAWVTGSLEHPNIVPIYDVGLDAAGHPLIVLKRIEGMEWGELMHDAKQVHGLFDTSDLLEWNLNILMQVCNAVHFAHSRGIVHRDLKPDNVMIGEFGEVYLLDWGIALSMKDDGTGRLPLAKDAIDMAGTPCYMAPEMFGGTPPSLSESTDVYLLGATLFEILAGHPPHQGQDLREIITSVLTGPPTPRGPVELVGICQRAMHVDVAQRQSGAEEVRLAVRAFLRHRVSHRLSHRATKRLDELFALAQTPVADEHTRRTRLHNLHSECRFGFHEALGSWPESKVALQGLRRAAEIIARYELSQDDPRAARSLLAEVEDVDPAFLKEIDEALAKKEVKQAQMELLSREMDMTLGQRTRMFIMSLFGTMWTAAPLYAGFTGYDGDGVETALLAAPFLGVLILLGQWARASISLTAINRQFFRSLVLVLVGQIILGLSMHHLGVPPITSQVMHIFWWAAILWMATITTEPRFWPTAVTYIGVIAVSVLNVEWRFFAIAFVNMVLTLNAFFVWKPEKGKVLSR